MKRVVKQRRKDRAFALMLCFLIPLACPFFWILPWDEDDEYAREVGKLPAVVALIGLFCWVVLCLYLMN